MKDTKDKIVRDLAKAEKREYGIPFKICSICDFPIAVCNELGTCLRYRARKLVKKA